MRISHAGDFKPQDLHHRYTLEEKEQVVLRARLRRAFQRFRHHSNVHHFITSKAGPSSQKKFTSSSRHTPPGSKSPRKRSMQKPYDIAQSMKWVLKPRGKPDSPRIHIEVDPPGITFPSGWSMPILSPALSLSIAGATSSSPGPASSSRWSAGAISNASDDDSDAPIIPRTQKLTPTLGSDDTSSSSSSYAWSPLLSSSFAGALGPFSSGSDDTSSIIGSRTQLVPIDSANHSGRSSSSSSGSSSYALSPMLSHSLSRASSTFSSGSSSQASAFGGDDDLDTVRRARRGVMKPHELCNPPSPQDCHGSGNFSSNDYSPTQVTSYAPHPYCFDPRRPHHY